MHQGMEPLAAFGLIGFFFFMVFGILSFVYLILQIMMIFSVFSIRKRVDEQQGVIDRIERHLATLVDRSRPPEPPPPTITGR
jgi:hypothetical protein